MTEDLVALVRQIAETPAPTFQEATRALFIASLWQAAGLAVEQDAVGNVWTRVGPQAEQAVCLAAHLDTVFPDPVVRTHLRGDHLCGLGVADDSAGLAVLVTLAVEAARQAWARPVLFLADVGEEGLGNLRGVEAFLDGHRDVGAFVSLDGRLGTVVRQGIGVRRLEVSVRTVGGHSWGDFGAPSAVHLLVRALSDLTELRLPATPRTTLNIGVVQGGTAVNAIAGEARALLDLRSLSAARLARLEEEVRSRLAQHLAGHAYTVTLAGERPAGALPARHPLVEAARAALGEVGVPCELGAGSTDANAPLARGIPAIAFGVVEGQGAHTTLEELHIPSLFRGLAAARALLRRLAG